MSVRPSRLLAASMFALVLVLAVPSLAGAATLRLDKACYISEGTARENMIVTATGFTPGATINLTANGRGFGSGQVNDDGTIKGQLKVPAIGGNEARFVLRANDGVNQATARFTASRLRADLFPRSGRARTWRTRFSIYGLGAAQRLLGQPVKRTIYAHWINPSGRVAGTKRIGTLSGACGHVVSVRQKTFPFGTAIGIWRIYFDPNFVFKRSERAYVRLSLEVRRIFL